MTITDLKSHFYTGKDFIHFNNAGIGPIPDVTRDEMKHWLDRYYKEGALCFPDCLPKAEEARKKLAKFLGAQTEEVAFFQTTASAISQAALGLDLNHGDEILTWDQEYPSNFYPWRMACERSGAKLIQIASDNWQTPAQKILDRVTKKTKVIAVSWVQYQTGAVTDLKKISSELKGTGIWLMSDIIQGAGVMPFDFQNSGFDIVCAGGYKWLCSSFGASFMIIKKDRIEELAPIQFGAISYGNPDTPKGFDTPIKPYADKFEPGSKSFLEMIGLAKTLDLFSAVGVQSIEKEANRLADSLRDGLVKKGFVLNNEHGPFVNFAPKDFAKTDSYVSKLEAAKIACAKRGPGIRLSIHAFNRDEEVARVLETLSA